MPKIRLEFNLPQETHEFQDYINGPRLASCIDDICDLIRQHYKYGPDSLSEDVKEFITELRQDIIEILSSRKIDSDRI